MGEFRIVGKSVPRLDAAEKVTGRAKFSADFKMSRMLFAKVLRSSHPHARIISIDTSEAENLSGVRAVITPRDVPAVTIAPLLGDQYVLCHDNVVRCVGEPVCAVAADTEEIAEMALETIKVNYEPLTAVFDAEEASRTDPPVVVHPDLIRYKALTGMPIRPDIKMPNVCQTYKIRSGNVAEGFQKADLIVESKFTTTRIQHCPLEPHVADAWFESDGSLTVRSSGQELYEMKLTLCKLFQLPPSKVRMLSTYAGGAFGGKAWIRSEAIAALLAQKTKRPVRLVFSREEMFVFGGNRVPFIIDIKDGIKNDGTLLAREIRTILSIGAYSEFGVLLVRRAATAAVGTYRIPNFKLDSYGVYTNLPLTGAFRGFGCTEVEWAIEQQMDIIANKLGIDPLEIRRENILNEGERDVSGMITRNIGVAQCLDEVEGWIDRLAKPTEEDGSWRMGKGIAIGNKSVLAGSTSVVIIKVWQDGMIEVRHSAMELGQGIKTTLAQIASEQFGIPIERVIVVSGDTAYCPFDFGTIASRSLIHNGNALIAACQDAKRQLFKMAAPKLGASVKGLEINNNKIYVKKAPNKSLNIMDLFTPLGVPLQGGEILGIGSYTCPFKFEDPDTGQSDRPVFDYSHAASAVEVAVNIETGEVKVLRSALACDVGKAINPKVVEGQMEGSIAMGIGSSVYEEVILDNGVVLNTNFMNYRIPTMTDVPTGDDNKAIIVEVIEPEGPFGAKGAGEVPMVAIAPSIANAVYDAVGIRIKDLPLSREKVLEAIKRRSNERSDKN